MEKYPELIGDMMFSNESLDKMEDREVEVNHPMEENPRVKQLSKKERFAFDANGKPFSSNWKNFAANATPSPIKSPK